MICDLCGEDIEEEAAIVINAEGSRYYHWKLRPKKSTCFIVFLQQTQQEWILGEIIASPLESK